MERALEETVARYLAAMLTHIKSVTEDLLQAMQKDNDTIISTFERILRPDKVPALPNPSSPPPLPCLPPLFTLHLHSQPRIYSWGRGETPFLSSLQQMMLSGGHE